MNSENSISVPFGDDAMEHNVEVVSYWNGEIAIPERHFSAALAWNDEGLSVRFAMAVGEPLVVSDDPILSGKTIGLWERDVCEIFIAPDKSEYRKYFEFEIGPTGEWLDLAIDSSSGVRITDWDYKSGMEASAEIEGKRLTMSMHIPWNAFGTKPKAGDVWLGNIFRCVGAGPDRGYLAWQPTLTELPNFHVPEQFGELIFLPANSANVRE
jgi:alpha-galactosidase